MFYVLYFYFCILSQIIFLAISRCYPFYTLRERAGFGKNMRLKKDYLEFVKDDLHDYLFCWTHMLCFFFLLSEEFEPANFSIYLAMNITFSVRSLVYFYLLHLIHSSKRIDLFTNGVFDLKKSRHATIVSWISSIITFVSIIVFILNANSTNSLYRFSFILLDVTIHIIMAMNFFIDNMFIRSQVIVWKTEYILQ